MTSHGPRAAIGANSLVQRTPNRIVTVLTSPNTVVALLHSLGIVIERSIGAAVPVLDIPPASQDVCMATGMTGVSAT